MTYGISHRDRDLKPENIFLFCVQAAYVRADRATLIGPRERLARLKIAQGSTIPTARFARPSLATRMLCKLAIATRADPQQPQECAPHYVDVTKSDSRRYLLEG